jgi:hypothetical protein
VIIPRWAPSLKPRPAAAAAEAAAKYAKPAPLSIFHKATLTARHKRMQVTLARSLRDITVRD